MLKTKSIDMQAQLLKKIVGIIRDDMNKFGKFNNHALVVVFYTFMHFFVYTHYPLTKLLLFHYTRVEKCTI